MTTQAPTPASTPASTPAAQGRRWPRRLAIGIAVSGALIGGTYWFLGRESTLQQLAQKMAQASDGSIVITGVSGSLYGTMHLKRLVYRSDEQRITADDVTIEWSPLQSVSGGILIDQLHVRKMQVETLRAGPAAVMPESLVAPFRLRLTEARIDQVLISDLRSVAGTDKQALATVIEQVRFSLEGGKRLWTLRDARASTPWGQARANAAIGTGKPFKLDANASLQQSATPQGQPPASLALRAAGDLTNTQIDASAKSGRASGTGRLNLAPFAAVPLRSMKLTGKNINPSFFDATLPEADVHLVVSAGISSARGVSGSIVIDNQGQSGPLDQQRLPLQALRASLSGTLDALRMDEVLIDLGEAGKLAGGGTLIRELGSASMGESAFTLSTERLDLNRIHTSVHPTRIAGQFKLTNTGQSQTLIAELKQAGLRLDAKATLAEQRITIEQLDLRAGKGSIRATGALSLQELRPFEIKAKVAGFNPGALGNYPEANLNADLVASGALAPQWQVAARFALRPSRLFGQALSGKGQLKADARHISALDARLALGKNTATMQGSFGAPGETLRWRVDAKQLEALRNDLYGSVQAHGVISGSMAEPLSTFELKANSLGWAKGMQANNRSELVASGRVWQAGGPAARLQMTLDGSAQRFNPAAFGSSIGAAINARFDATATLGSDWNAAANLTLDKTSTLAKSPLWGHARLAASTGRISKADIDLHVGSNIVAASGSFGRAADVLDWRIDAPQLAALGPEFAGQLRGAGTLSGTMNTPSLSLKMDGKQLRLPGGHRIGQLSATANLAKGRGAGDPLASDITISDFASGATRIDAARLQTDGTRAAHRLRLAVRNDFNDASADLSGSWRGDTWSGTVAELKNQGRFAFALQAPVPLTLSTAPGTGVIGLLKPRTIALGNARLALPAGHIDIGALNKNGPRWTSSGKASGVPMTYLAQFSDQLRDSVKGDLVLGAQWELDLRTAAATRAAPKLDGSLHVYRESGDLTVGADVPVVLGLTQLDARADIAAGALRVQMQIDGKRAGQARLDARAQLINGLLSEESKLGMELNADMDSIAWLAPLSGQPGLELDGQLQLNLRGAGTIGAPTLEGPIKGDQLAVRLTEQGVKLRGGTLRARLAGEQLLLERLHFQGGAGDAQVSGVLGFSGAQPRIDLKLVADKLELLSRPDRTLVVSGQSALTRNADRFALEGTFTADRALIELAPQDRPTMSSDIIVLGRERPRAGAGASEVAGLPLEVDILANLGEQFHLRGMGIDAFLTGSARIRTPGGGAPRVNGTIKVAKGSYKAYGQNLTIERGVLTFNGPYDNPALNILALRKQPEGEPLSTSNVEAGVAVRGTALSPSARLVSTPTVPDSEKLAWLVLGHGMDGVSGQEAGLLGAAASALLGGSGNNGFQSRLANTLGVDDVGLSQSDGLESTVVRVGKRISDRAYLSFEQGATSASSLVKVRYKLNPRVTLQFQTGTNTALDVLYSWAFD
jgi:translocation and assembly module TamB